MFEDKILPRSREEGEEMFNQAIKALEDPLQVIKAAEHLDLLFCLPELCDIGPLSHGDELEKSTREFQEFFSKNKGFYKSILNEGFEFAARQFESTREAPEKLGMFHRNQYWLFELFHKIREGASLIDDVQSEYKIPESWANRFLKVGRLPEIRIYDLEKKYGWNTGRPISLSRDIYPSPLTARLKGKTLEVQMQGLEEFKDRKVYCGLFLKGSDFTFTQRSLSELSEDERIKYDVKLCEGWYKANVTPEDWKNIRKDNDEWNRRGVPIDINAWTRLKQTVEESRVYEFKVVKDEEPICLSPVNSPSSLTNEIFVLIAD